MRKYIFWSENPRLENIQVICLDKKTIYDNIQNLIFLKKIEINCHKTEIHYKKNFITIVFRFLKVQNEWFVFKTIVFFKNETKNYRFCLKTKRKTVVLHWANHIRLARVMKMMKTYKINLLSKLLMIFVNHHSFLVALFDKLWRRIS